MAASGANDFAVGVVAIVVVNAKVESANKRGAQVAAIFVLAVVSTVVPRDRLSVCSSWRRSMSGSTHHSTLDSCF